MKLTIVLTLLLTLAVPGKCYAQKLLNEVSEIFIVVQFADVPVEEQRGLLSMLELNAEKAGLKVLGTGSLEDYSKWLTEKVAAREKQVSETKAVSQTLANSCIVNVDLMKAMNKAGTAYLVTITAKRLAYLLTDDGLLTIALEPSGPGGTGGQLFRATLVPAVIYEAPAIFWISANSATFAQEVEKQFNAFLNEWKQRQPSTKQNKKGKPSGSAK